jgi:uncharacterized protein YjbJ (UPF0337 family)
MNENTVKGKWLETKGDLQKAWGNLTDDELEKTQGDIKAIKGLIQKRYGDLQESSADKLSDIFKRFESKKDSVVKNVKNAINNKH